MLPELQGIYVPQLVDGATKLQVNTFCVHGGPGGRLSGIQGSVTCANPELLELLPEFKTKQEKSDKIVGKVGWGGVCGGIVGWVVAVLGGW